MTCQYCGISRDTFYRWKKNYKSKGEIGSVNCKPCPQNPKLRTPAEIKDKIFIYVNTMILGSYGSVGIYGVITKLRFQQLGVHRVLKRHGMNRFPKNLRKRSIPTPQRYEKQALGHHIQVDVKFLFLKIIMENKSNGIHISL